jgi:hypothetical protein
VGGCFPWDFLHQGGFLGHNIFSAWVWPPGDARQFAREPVTCDSCVCMWLPIKAPMFDRAVCACGDGYLGILTGLARRPLGKCSILSSITASVQDGIWRPTFGWAEHEPQSFSTLLHSKHVLWNSTLGKMDYVQIWHSTWETAPTPQPPLPTPSHSCPLFWKQFTTCHF